jgi:hypothetical protein
MKNIVINKGNILKYGLNLNYRSAIVLSAINHIFQNNSFSPFDSITDEFGNNWFGCSNNQIINELPILKLQKNSSRKIINILIDLGFIERHIDSQKLSKTFIKPAQNFKLYFENNKDEIYLDQNSCFNFDRRLHPLHWILLEAIEKTTKNIFVNNFAYLDEAGMMKYLEGVINGKFEYRTVLAQLVSFGYLEKSEIYKTKKFYYKSGAKFTQYQEYKTRKERF